MPILGLKVDLKIRDNFQVVGYITKFFDEQYYVLYSIELPIKLVIHKSWIEGSKVVLPSKFSAWVEQQLSQVQLPRSEAFFDA